jgi:hypothetical protein
LEVHMEVDSTGMRRWEKVKIAAKFKSWDQENE